MKFKEGVPYYYIKALNSFIPVSSAIAVPTKTVSARPQDVTQSLGEKLPEPTRKKYAPRGVNPAKVLKALRPRRGSSPMDLAEATGLTNDVVSRSLYTLRQKGKVKRTDTGWIRL